MSNWPNRDTQLDLNFIAMLWSKCPHHKGHAGLNLRRIAECYVKLFSEHYLLVDIWGNYFAYGEAKNFDVMKKLELERTANLVRFYL